MLAFPRSDETVHDDPRSARSASSEISMTRLSHCPADEVEINRRGQPLARRSQSLWGVIPHLALLVALAVASPGCLLSSPPDVELPGQTPPLLYQASPVITNIISVPLEQAAPTLTFSVRLRSEDQNQLVAGDPFLNYNTDREEAIVSTLFRSPSTFDDTSRSFGFELSPSRLSVGCQQVTLRAHHIDGAHPDQILEDDTAFVTWWLDVHTADSPPNTLESCPISGTGGG